MNRLREIRVKAGMSQSQVAERAGISQGEISRFERLGISPRSPLHRSRIAKALEVPVNVLFPDDVEPELAKYEPIPMTRTICRWCGMRYSPDKEAKIMVGDVVIKTYGHLSCLEQDVRSDGLELKKRHALR